MKTEALTPEELDRFYIENSMEINFGFLNTSNTEKLLAEDYFSLIQELCKDFKPKKAKLIAGRRFSILLDDQEYDLTCLEKSSNRMCELFLRDIEGTFTSEVPPQNVEDCLNDLIQNSWE